MHRLSLTLIPLASALLLGACSEREVAPPVAEEASQVARAPLMTAEGQSVGEAILAQGDRDLLLTLTVTGMPAGQHGVHVHMTGACEAPDFTSAGGHWNPGDTEHGLNNPMGAHAGDMPNLLVAEDGSGKLEAVLSGAMLRDGERALMDDDGAAFVVHAGPDDQMTDPSGDSGDRIACGVFAMSTGGAN